MLSRWFRSVIEATFSLGALLLAFEAAARFHRGTTALIGFLNFSIGVQELLSAMVIFVIVNIPLVLAECLSPGTTYKRNYFQGAKFWIMYIVTTYYWSKLTIIMMAKFQIAPLFAWSVDNNPDSIVGITTMAIGILLPIFVFDGFYYWFHRAQHRFVWLWRFHKVHHSIVHMNCINSYHHVLEDILRFPFVVLPLALLLKVDAPQMVLLSAFVAAWGQYIHSDTSIHLGRLNAIFGDNAYHRLHHSVVKQHFNKNFAAFFPLWDRLFGTYHKPEQGGLPTVGLTKTPPPRSVADYLSMPFR